jgi:DNA-binding MarR family transcriptional regulator
MLQTGMRLQAAVNKRFLKHGLTMLDASVVLLCVKAPLGVTPGKLAVSLGRDKGKITHVVDRLQSNGFVTRTGGRHDRRISLIRPTRKAKKIAPVLGTLLIGVRRQLFAAVAESDLKYLTNSLVRLRENVKSVAYACDGHEYEKPKRGQP